jgi:tetratricopeptide (TPR) repeat protein
VFGAYSAYCLARYPEALEHLDELLRCSEGDHGLGLATMGFPGWSQSWRFRSQALCEMGRLEEARASLAKAEEILRAEPQSEVNTWAVGDHVRIAHSAGLVPPFQGEDPRPAALDALDYSERVGSDFARASSGNAVAGLPFVGRPRVAGEAPNPPGLLVVLSTCVA